jgi:hypothetical protein
MGRRTFSREFKFEAVKLVKDRGVSVTHGCRRSGYFPERIGPVGPRGERGSEAGILGTWADEAG